VSQAAQPAPTAPAAHQAQPVPVPDRTVATVGTPAPAPQRVEDVPQLLNRWQVAAVAVTLVFGVVSALLQFLGWQANGAAADNTEQLVRVQGIQSSLFRANALATNAFLAGELESADQRAEYDATLDEVLAAITDAAEAQPADRKALAALNSEVASYVAAIAQARDNNRQGFPIGVEYLIQAGQTLKAESAAIIGELVEANAQRAEDEMDGQHPLWLFWAGIGALAALWWLNRQVAKRFHRRLNVGLTAAAVGVALVTLLAVLLAEDQAGDNDDLVVGSYESAADAASVRASANDAKANESLRLIKRGAGESYEESWTAASDNVEQRATGATRAAWQTYAALHEEIVELDRSGRWEQAVEAATGREDGSATRALDAVDRAAQADVTEAAEQTTDTLRSGREFAIGLAGATLLVGMLAAVLCAWGINQRRKEYA